MRDMRVDNIEGFLDINYINAVNMPRDNLVDC